jgi:hypothetical protein
MLGNHAADTLPPLTHSAEYYSTATVQPKVEAGVLYDLVVQHGLISAGPSSSGANRTVRGRKEKDLVDACSMDTIKGVLFSVLLPFTLTLVQACLKRSQAL